MALLAIRSETTAVNIVARVTIHASSGRMSGISQIRFVTQAACKLLMRALQRVFGGLIVIERPADPRRGVMAGLAALTKDALMGVVPLVACAAGLQGLMERAREMTALAG